MSARWADPSEQLKVKEQPVHIQRVSWSDLCPWTIIFKTLPVAASVTVLVLALIGVCLTPMGWLLSETIFVNQETRESNPFLAETIELNRSPYRGVFSSAIDSANSFQIFGVRVSGPRLVFQQIAKPFFGIFDGSATGREFLYFLFGSVWTLFVWSFLGVGIARVCLLRLTRNEQAGLDDAFEFAMDKFMTCVLAIGMPLAAVFLMCIPTFILGLIMGFDFGTVIVGVLWFVVLGIATIMGILLLGLLFGWPLIVSSVAAEGQNSFDAMTRAYAYTFQRPVHYLFYLLIAILFGGFCWLIVGQFTEGIVNLSYWSTAWGANRTSSHRIDVIQGRIPIQSATRSGEADIVPELNQTESPEIPGKQRVDNSQNQETQPLARQADRDTLAANGADNVAADNVDSMNQPSSSLETGRKIIAFWIGMAKTFAAAFIYGLFWCMASAIYLLLRRDVDETEMDEIYLVDERRTYDLPPLKSDADGIPQVQPLSSSDSGSNALDSDDSLD